jgi:hypothetical protein
VRLKPGRVKWEYADLAHPWRDLEEDRKHGRTAYRVLWPQGKGKGKNRKKPIRPPLELLVRWTLGIREAPPPEVLLTRRDPTDIAELFALTDLDPQERPDAIQALAERMAHFPPPGGLLSPRLSLRGLCGDPRGSAATPCGPAPAPGPSGAFPCAKGTFAKVGG